MFIKKLIFFTLFINSIVCFGQSTDNKPIECKSGIYIKSIKLNEAEEKFDALFYWWFRVDSIDLSKDYSTIGAIEYINAEVSQNDTVQVVFNKEERYYYITGICKASFPYKTNYINFPFENHKLTIIIENKFNNIENLKYIHDIGNQYINKVTDTSINILNGDQFMIDSLNTDNSIFTYKSNFGDPSISKFDSYSRLNFNVYLSRNPLGILQKAALPLAVVLILSYLVFFIPAHELSTAASLTVTALLAAIAFQWTLKDSLPRVSYLTLIDKLFYLVYIYIFYSMVVCIVTYKLHHSGDLKQQNMSKKIDIYSRFVFPISFIFILWLILSIH